MKPTKSDITVTKVHLIMVLISIILTILFYLCIAAGIGIYSSLTGADDYFNSTLTSPWVISVVLLFHDLTFSNGPEMTWWATASAVGILGFGVNFGVLTTSILGLRVRKIEGIGWMGFLLGVIGAGVSLTVIFNVMLWWLPGFVLSIISCVLTIKTLKELKNWQPENAVDELTDSEGSQA